MKSFEQNTKEDLSKRFEKYARVIEDVPLLQSHGKVREIIGSLIVSEGPLCKLGDICKVISRSEKIIDCEVIGIRGGNVLLGSYGNMEGITHGDKVISYERPLSVMCSEEMLGQVLNGRGLSLDGSALSYYADSFPVVREAVNPLLRKRIDTPIQTGVRAIDGLLTVGKGQRVAIMSGTGVGKSTLLSMIARNTNADVNVIALVGERRREVLEFIERDLGEEGLKKSVVIVATSDEAPLMRLRSAYVATTIAEYFRDMGKDVMFMVDSVTRFALAQREIGLARGEPPTTRGYTPSVFSELSYLLERTGTSDKGSITAFYNVLVEGDDLDEPISDAVRGMLDGHIVLSRDIANRSIYPAIDVNKSISRLAKEIVSKRHMKAISKFMRMNADYSDVRELIMIGGYAKGSMPEVDEAIRYKPIMDKYIIQDVYEKAGFAESKVNLLSMFFQQKEVEEEMAEYQIENSEDENMQTLGSGETGSEEEITEVLL